MNRCECTLTRPAMAPTTAASDGSRRGHLQGEPGANARERRLCSAWAAKRSRTRHRTGRRRNSPRRLTSRNPGGALHVGEIRPPHFPTADGSKAPSRGPPTAARRPGSATLYTSSPLNSRLPKRPTGYGRSTTTISATASSMRFIARARSTALGSTTRTRQRWTSTPAPRRQITEFGTRSPRSLVSSSRSHRRSSTGRAERSRQQGCRLATVVAPSICRDGRSPGAGRRRPSSSGPRRR